jgi:uncharacterized protein
VAKRAIMHVEIPTTNREATARFYSTLFGWEVEPFDNPQAYRVLQAGNMSIGLPDLQGGFRPVTDVLRAGDIVPYVTTDDMEGDLTQIEAMGGKIVLPRTEVAKDTWVAVLEDPNGARLALTTGKPSSG